MNKKVLVGLSGGLDSAYACRLLQEQGYECVGASLLFHSLSDPAPALALAQRLGISCVVEDQTEAFEEHVIRNFVAEYSRGRTPNPCAVCNKHAKLSGLIACADRLGIEKIATGHYVALSSREGRTELRMAADLSRDQSYFLWDVPQKVFGRMLTPLSKVIKKEIPSSVRSMICAGESRELCFAEGSYVEALLERGISAPAGDFVDTEGRVLGRHSGIFRYTVGQRKGLEIALGRRCYVLKIEPESNRVVLGFEEEAECRGFSCGKLNFVSEPPFEGRRELLVKVRYGARPVRVTAEVCGGVCRATFEEAQKPVAPGQSAVFYEDDRLIFGGVIEESV